MIDLSSLLHGVFYLQRRISDQKFLKLWQFMKDRHIYNFSRENFVSTNRETNTQGSRYESPWLELSFFELDSH